MEKYSLYKMVKTLKENFNKDIYFKGDLISGDIDIATHMEDALKTDILLSKLYQVNSFINLSDCVEDGEQFFNKKVFDFKSIFNDKNQKFNEMALLYLNKKSYKNAVPIFNFFNIYDKKKIKKERKSNSFLYMLCKSISINRNNKEKSFPEVFYFDNSVFLDNFDYLYQVVASFEDFKNGLKVSINKEKVLKINITFEKNEDSSFTIKKAFNLESSVVEFNNKEENIIKYQTKNSFITPCWETAKSVINDIPSPVMRFE